MSDAVSAISGGHGNHHRAQHVQQTAGQQGASQAATKHNSATKPTSSSTSPISGDSSQLSPDSALGEDEQSNPQLAQIFAGLGLSTSQENSLTQSQIQQIEANPDQAQQILSGSGSAAPTTPPTS